MRRKCHTSKQLVRKLPEAEELKNEGQTIGQICQSREISEQAYRRWKNDYGGMGEGQAHRLKELESENQRLKKLLADAHLDMHIMQIAMQGKSRVQHFDGTRWLARNVNGRRSRSVGRAK